MPKKTEPVKTPDSKPRARKTGARGRHAERSAAMRKNLIEAATWCLGEYGYGGTTMQRITDKAGVSRGAFLHHFPTRIDLLVAVAENSAIQQNRHVARILSEVEPGVARYEALTMATWDAMLQPSSIALLEIMMGARSDPELRDSFPPVIENLQTLQMEGVWGLAKTLGMTDRKKVMTMVRLHVAAMRGLVLEYMYSGDLGLARESMSLLKEYKDDLTAKLLPRDLGEDKS